MGKEKKTNMDHNIQHENTIWIIIAYGKDQSKNSKERNKT